MSDDATLDEFTVDSEESNESDMTAESNQTTDDLQTLEASPVEGWELLRLGDVLSFEYGDNLPANTRQDGKIPVYGSNGQVDTHTEANVDRAGIIIGRKGSIGEGEFSSEPFWAIDTTYYVSSKETDENLRFTHYLLQDMELERLNAASAIPGLNRNDAYNLNALIPLLSEQRKIVTVLHTIDQAIQRTEKIIDSIERIKRGILQNTIFDVGSEESVDRRFGPKIFIIPEYWKRVRLQEVTDLITRGKQPIYADEGIPVINQECIYWDGFRFENIRYLDKKEANEWKDKYFVSDGDVVINSTGRGTLGRAQTYTDDIRRAVDSHVTIVRPDTERMTAGYLRYFLESNRGQGLLYSMCVTGSTGQIELSKSKLQLLSIPLPPKDEQKEIVDTLKRFDYNIRCQQEYKEQLRVLKQGLMQDLLSGEVRTTDAEIDIPEEVAKYG